LSQAVPHGAAGRFEQAISKILGRKSYPKIYLVPDSLGADSG
jgi:hypothetical protein